MEELAFCSNCGNRTLCTVVDITDVFLPKSSNDYWENYMHTCVLKCSTCSRYILKTIDDGYIGAIEDETIRLTKDDWFQLYPVEIVIDEAVPHHVRDLVLETFRLKQRSQEQFSVRLRKIVEEILKDQKVQIPKFKSLSKWIGLAKWPQRIKKLAHCIRIVGNIAAHEKQIDRINKYDNIVTYSLVELLAYLYVNKVKYVKIEEVLQLEERKKSDIS